MSQLDLEVVLDAVVAHLVAGKALEESGIPNLTTVSKGDYQTPDAKKVHLTVDWAGSQFDLNLSGLNGLQKENAEIALRGYLSDIPNDDEVNAFARELKTTILAWMRRFKSTGGYMLTPVSARYIQPAEKPGFRFTIGVEVRFAVRMFG
jgi:hypothetical protein